MPLLFFHNQRFWDLKKKSKLNIERPLITRNISKLSITDLISFDLVAAKQKLSEMRKSFHQRIVLWFPAAIGQSAVYGIGFHLGERKSFLDFSAEL